MSNGTSKLYINKVSVLFLIADISVIWIVYVFLVTLLAPDTFFAHLKDFFQLFIVLTVTWFLSEISYNLYVEDRLRSNLAYNAIMLLKGVFFMEIAVVVINYLRDPPFLPFSFTIVWPVAVLFCLGIEKYITIQLVLFLRQSGYNIRRIVLLGGGENAIYFNNLVHNNLFLGYKVLGYFDKNPQPQSSLKYLGEEENLESFLAGEHVNEIVITYSEISTNEIATITNSADKAGIRVRVIPNFHFLYHRKYEFWQLGRIPTFTLRREPLEKMGNKFVKRTFDIIFSALVLIFICSWLIPLIAVLIRLNSKGRIFFRQKRMGRDRKDFVCYKFRSMYENEDADKIMATRNDSRITAVGKFLRKTSLDEFPQFWNVLKGDMSIVGPRPHMSIHNLQYQEKIEKYLVRQLIRPGITGWAQVNGYRGEIKSDKDIRKRVEYDIWYLENWNFILDLKIVFLTIWSVFRRKGNAY